METLLDPQQLATAGAVFPRLKIPDDAPLPCKYMSHTSTWEQTSSSQSSPVKTSYFGNGRCLTCPAFPTVASSVVSSHAYGHIRTNLTSLSHVQTWRTRLDDGWLLSSASQRIGQTPISYSTNANLADQSYPIEVNGKLASGHISCNSSSTYVLTAFQRQNMLNGRHTLNKSFKKQQHTRSKELITSASYYRTDHTCFHHLQQNCVQR